MVQQLLIALACEQMAMRLQKIVGHLCGALSVEQHASRMSTIETFQKDSGFWARRSLSFVWHPYGGFHFALGCQRRFHVAALAVPPPPAKRSPIIIREAIF